MINVADRSWIPANDKKPRRHTGAEAHADRPTYVH
jgi:hypothetical protein